MRLNGLENVNESLSTHYTIYKITNNINGKYYIGQHKTNDIYDDYMGSGYALPAAYKKYGIENFTKTILFDFDNFEDMNNKECELVLLSNCWPIDNMSYNLVVGGHGRILPPEKEAIRIQHVKETWNNKTLDEKIKYSLLKKQLTLGKNNPMYGKNARDYMDSNSLKEMDRKRRETWKLKTKDQLKEKERKRQESINSRSLVEKLKTHELLSKASSGKNNPMYGRKRMHLKNHPEISLMVLKTKFAEFLSKGYVFNDSKFVYKYR